MEARHERRYTVQRGVLCNADRPAAWTMYPTRTAPTFLTMTNGFHFTPRSPRASPHPADSVPHDLPGYNVVTHDLLLPNGGPASALSYPWHPWAVFSTLLTNSSTRATIRILSFSLPSSRASFDETRRQPRRRNARIMRVIIITATTPRPKVTNRQSTKRTTQQNAIARRHDDASVWIQESSICKTRNQHYQEPTMLNSRELGESRV